MTKMWAAMGAVRSSGWSILTIVVATGMGSTAGAREPVTRTVGDWSITASRDGRGCFLTRTYDRPGGTTLLLGLDSDGTNRVTVLNDNWSIAPKDRLKLTFRLTNASFPGHFAVGIAAGGKKGFVTSFGGKFPDHFAASRTLAIFRGDVPVERLDLGGSGAAVAELRSCVQSLRTASGAEPGKQTSAGSIPKDPFAAAVRPSKRK